MKGPNNNNQDSLNSGPTNIIYRDAQNVQSLGTHKYV